MAVSRGVKNETTIFGVNGFRGVAVAAVGPLTGLMFIVAEMVIQLSIERGFDGDFGQDLAEFSQILLGFNAFWPLLWRRLLECLFSWYLQ